MPEIVITDTSCLIILDKLHSLHFLHNIYSRIYITPEVSEEFGNPLPSWVLIEPVINVKYKNFLKTMLDLGEASIIALSLEKSDPLLILDDLRARNFAKRLELKVTGSLAVLFKAKEIGLISNLRPYVAQLKENGFRLSNAVIEYYLKKAGEY